uniref:Nitric-oxide reductase large subunit n=1 Tax=Fundidesulfovibrio putealis TaxID=270496 RepID=A0A7C4AGB6_9BACT
MIGKGLKAYFLIGLFGSIAVALIGYVYTERDLPPYPDKVVTETGQTLTTKARIMAGQQNFQKYGLMDVGSVWGHGTYRGPDFTAQALHMAGQFMREKHAMDRHGKEYAALDEESRGGVDAVAIKQIKANRYDPGTRTLTLTKEQEHALGRLREFYDGLFLKGETDGPIRPDTIASAGERRDLADFFFWTAWCAGSIRPGDEHTYTNNWPNDASVGNVLSGYSLVWSAASLVAFGICLGFVIMLYHREGYNKGALSIKPELAAAMARAPVSESQRKTAKYFFVVAVLFIVQMSIGGLMAHYTVNPAGFYGLDFIADLFPYNQVKTWHLQLAVFWIATAWLGMTLFVSPRVGGREPVAQGILVDVLFAAVIFVAVGSLAGEALGIRGMLKDGWFWFGHQGWEYLELGRAWQILLLVGLVIWLALVLRGLASHFAPGADKWGLPNFLAYSGVAVVGFFGFGLLYDPDTHLTIADFWRWWVVHTWVEGAFEFFAAAAIAFVVINLGLTDLKSGLRAMYFTVSLALFSGIIGVGHHYYWFGEPSFWLALGSTISALEPVPILLLLAEVWHGQKLLLAAGSGYPYRYPMLFIMSAIFWEFLGAGVMGLSITTPMINYYEHATYLTVNHGHTALFGTYGILAIGLLLFSMRGLVTEKGWDERLLRLSLWGVNLGLASMFVLTLLPVGLLQVLDNIRNGLWHARSNAFWSKESIVMLGQIRMIPDTILIVLGAGGLLLFMLRAMTNLKDAQVKSGQAFPQ